MNINTQYTCRICSNNKKNRIFIARELMLGLKHEFVYFKCSNCGCLQIAEFPDNISDYYPKTYYSFQKVENGMLKKIYSFFSTRQIKAGLLPSHLLGNFLFDFFSMRNVKFLRGIVDTKHVRILDVGCGNGKKFLEPLYKAGFNNVEGCDPFIDSDKADSNGPNLYKKDLSQMNGEWDLITFNHSFEHVDNPLSTLQTANNLLVDNGYCIIRIPTVSSFAWKQYGTNWFQLDAPRHFFIHSIRSLRLLSEKAGFKMVKQVSDSTHHQFTISERYKNGNTLQERNYNSIAGRLLHVVKKSIYTIQAHRLNNRNLGDQAIFYLQKI